LFDLLRKPGPATGARFGGTPQETGSIEEGLAQASVKLKGTYSVAYIAHVPLEPRAAVAQWEG